jgi:hypothetical protein
LPSNALRTYERLRQDLDTLLSYHPAFVGVIKGRPAKNTGPLLRASLVLLVTAWENYVEEVVDESFGAVRDVIADDAGLLSTHLRGVVAASGKADPWSITGSGWMDVIALEVKKQIESLNNASSGQVDALCAKTFGVADMLHGITWPGRAAGTARELLAELVWIRGEIVHKGTTPGTLDLDGVKSWLGFVDRLVSRFDQVLSTALQGKFDIAAPWPAR